MKIFSNVLVGAAAICFAISYAPPANSEVSILYNNFTPPKHPITLIAKAWSGDVTKASKSEIKFRFPAKGLAPPPRQWGMIVNGIADTTFTANLFQSKRLTLPSVADLPLGTTTAAESSVALWRTYKKYFEAANEYKGVKLLGLFVHSGGDLGTGKKEINVVGDIKNMKLRVSRGVNAKSFAAMGAVVVPTPGVKAFEVVSKGIVDGLSQPASDVFKFKMTPYVKFITFAPGKFYNTAFSIILNQKKWDGLSSAHKAAVTASTGEKIGRHARFWDIGQEAGVRALKKAGVKFKTASPAFMSEMKKKVAFLTDEWLKKAAARGVDGKAALDYYHNGARK
jgi:TRAP-type C4-dicarboxylate transport system substrate-binding protein|tara:strand:+ start:269 stop:1282 length:1014 start_codon:yes stop_codon:yes gene_type:complete